MECSKELKVVADVDTKRNELIAGRKSHVALYKFWPIGILWFGYAGAAY